MNYEFDTITAPATALGTSGVAVIRISGSKAFEIINKIFKGNIETGKICYGKIINNFAFNIFIAVSLFLICERSVWQVTTIPVAW